MCKRVLVGLCAAGAAMLVAQAAVAVNCDQVRRYLSTGRSAEDVADTMIISIDDVKKCQQGGGEQKGGDKPAKPEEKPAEKK